MDTYQTVQERQREAVRASRVQFMWFMAVLTLLSFIFASGRSEGAESDFTATSPECETCFTYFEPLPRVWEGDIEIVFNPNNLPWWANTTKIESRIHKTIAKIQTYADVPFVYTGTTELTVVGQYASERRHTVLISSPRLTFWAGVIFGGDGMASTISIMVRSRLTTRFQKQILMEFSCMKWPAIFCTWTTIKIRKTLSVRDHRTLITILPSTRRP